MVVFSGGCGCDGGRVRVVDGEEGGFFIFICFCLSFGWEFSFIFGLVFGF